MTKCTIKRRRPQRRARERGFTHVSAVLEAAMVMGWFVALIVGEQLVSDSAAARRDAEDGAQKTSAASAAAFCAPSPIAAARTRVSASVDAKPKLDVSRAISALAGLGLGGQRTFPYYKRPLLGIEVKTSVAVDERTFAAGRRLGCLERPLDTPAGSIDVYRAAMWLTNLKGY